MHSKPLEHSISIHSKLPEHSISIHSELPEQSMRHPISILLLVAHFAMLLASCRNPGESQPPRPAPGDSLTFAFYNVENLWDPANDPAGRGDDDFTPEGTMRWTAERMERKLDAIARAVRSIDGMRGPDLIGMCEMENRRVLDLLVTDYLPGGEYEVVHAESPDERGIDVAILYRRGVMRLDRMTMHRIDLGEGNRPTRDIMEARFSKDGRSFTVLVNHWPSRSGGEEASAPRRERAAEAAARVIDSITTLDPTADIILMGDLNDEPFNTSVAGTLDAREYVESGFDHRLINTAAPVAEIDTLGSYYYQGDWETIDQVMLASAGALDGKGITLYQTSETIFAPPFLRDARADPVALPPHRTYIRGSYYIGGTSDHFPVFLRVGWVRDEGG
jgi:predicted extracellular nuclease